MKFKKLIIVSSLLILLTIVAQYLRQRTRSAFTFDEWFVETLVQEFPHLRGAGQTIDIYFENSVPFLNQHEIRTITLANTKAVFRLIPLSLQNFSVSNTFPRISIAGESEYMEANKREFIVFITNSYRSFSRERWTILFQSNQWHLTKRSIIELS
jgi:hypothetical protein